MDKYKKIVILILFWMPWSGLFSQDTDTILIQKYEHTLIELFNDMSKYNNDVEREKLNDKITKKLEQLLSIEGSFSYPFDSLRYIGKIISKDKKLRIYTWNLPYINGTHKYFGFIQYYPPKEKNFRVIYRPAQNRDKEAILKFEIECKKTEPEVYISEYNNLRRKLPSINFNKRKDFKIVLALVDNKIVGLLSMSWYFDYERNCKVGVIPGLWVLKSYRMAGIGKGLIKFAKEKFRTLEVGRIELVENRVN